MNKQRRRELKKMGTALVKERSAEVRSKIHERNPFPVGHPNWVKNLQTEYQLNREFRHNSTQVLRADDVQERAEIKRLGFVYGQDDRMHPRPSWYLQCSRCLDLVPTNCTLALQCSCGSVAIDPTERTYEVLLKEHSVVELVGRGSIRAEQQSKPWWKFWR